MGLTVQHAMPDNVQMRCRGTGASWTSWQLTARQRPPTGTWHMTMPSEASQHLCCSTRGGGWTRCLPLLCSNHTCLLRHDTAYNQPPGALAMTLAGGCVHVPRLDRCCSSQEHGLSQRWRNTWSGTLARSAPRMPSCSSAYLRRSATSDSTPLPMLSSRPPGVHALYSSHSLPALRVRAVLVQPCLAERSS